jgi:hypothetical protein
MEIRDAAGHVQTADRGFCKGVGGKKFTIDVLIFYGKLTK